MTKRRSGKPLPEVGKAFEDFHSCAAGFLKVKPPVLKWPSGAGL
jgi:hypothetical protein